MQVQKSPLQLLIMRGGPPAETGQMPSGGVEGKPQGGNKLDWECMIKHFNSQWFLLFTCVDNQFHRVIASPPPPCPSQKSMPEVILTVWW